MIKKQNLAIALLFAISTAFFIYQHFLGISWDFSVYVLNAKYLFANGFYFEWFRPPLTSFIIGLLSIFGWKATEYIYIISVSLLFAYSSIIFAKKMNINPALYYALILNPFTLFFAFNAGTELLSLALLQLFVAHLFAKRSAIYLSLASLTRYANLVFIPLIFFKKKFSKILQDIVVLILIWLPWLAFNWYSTGNPFHSIFSLLNKTNVPVSLLLSVVYIFIAFNWLLPTMILGIKSKLEKKDWVIIFILVLILIGYFATAYREPRFLFNLVLPAAYFSAKYLSRIKSVKFVQKYVIASFLIVFLIFSPIINISYIKQNPEPLQEIISETDNCAMSSNAWLYFNYLGKPVEPAPRKENIISEIGAGKRLLLFKNTISNMNIDISDVIFSDKIAITGDYLDYLEDKEFISQFPIIKETKDYVILGYEENCAQIRPVILQ